MSKHNLISVSFTDEELTTLDNALQQIKSVLEGKTVNLTPDEKQLYSKISEENKLIVNKVADVESNYPEHHPPFLDKEEFDRDYKTRTQIESRISKMQSMLEELTDTKTLLDHDNYTYSVAYYRYIKMLSSQDVPGVTSIYEDMKKVYASQIDTLRKARAEKKAATSTPEEE